MPTPEPATVAADLRVAMGKLARRVKQEDRIPHGQVAVLGVLDRDGAMTTSDLAADQRVRPQSMARAVGLLMDQGLVVRRAHPTDGRKSSSTSPTWDGPRWRPSATAAPTGSPGPSTSNSTRTSRRRSRAAPP